MTHKHNWKRDHIRTHGDEKRGRFFVICHCGERSQAVIVHGHLHVFQTNRYRGGSNVISFRVSDQQYKAYLLDKEGFYEKAKKILSR